MPLLPVRSGWDPWSGDDPFYPDDLPPEWRLAYFANVCWAVAVPAEVWRAAGAAGARDWARDTPPRFRFYLEAEPGSPTIPAAPVAAALGDRFGGLIGTPPGAEQALDLAPQPILDPRAGPDADLSATRGLAWTVPAAVIDDPRAARTWIERRVSASPAGLMILALLGPCPGAVVEQWQTLVELMDVSRRGKGAWLNT